MRLVFIPCLLLLILQIHSTMAADWESAPQAADELTLPPGFKAERLISVPRDYASWVSMTFDPQGRLIVSDQGYRVSRVTLAPFGQAGTVTSVETIDLGVGCAQGLLYAHKSLYVVSASDCPDTGVFRLPDADGQGNFGKPEFLLKIPGAHEHGPHGIVAGPEEKWLYVIAGNHCELPQRIARNHVAQIAPTERAPLPSAQGYVVRITPDGNRRELFCQGMRNAYDLAFSPDGELFAYDSDSEGFMGLPWYRPTNLLHLVSGADYGWRDGPANFAPYYPDCPSPVAEIGPGSPTGLAFGAAAEFPEKYRRALFACDWSYGRIYAIFLKPRGATYGADWEVFASARPLPSTDIQVGPDGHLYVITGGRGAQTHLYRIYWDGAQPNTTQVTQSPNHACQQRSRLEQFNAGRDPQAVDAAWPHLQAEGRALRYAARTALEHQPVRTWQERVFLETNRQALLEGLLALARQGDADIRPRILAMLPTLDWEELSLEQRHALLRVYGITFERLAMPTGEQAVETVNLLNSRYPSGIATLDRELATLLHGFKASGATVAGLAERTVALVSETPTLMQQIHFIRLLARDDIESLSQEERELLRTAIDPYELAAVAGRPYPDQQLLFKTLISDLGVEPVLPGGATERSLVAEWTLAELLPVASEHSLAEANRRNGQSVYRQARCANCHRLGSSGGVLGPNLNGLAGHYTPAEVLESIVLPSKVISDQYRTTLFAKNDGTTVRGTLVNLEAAGYKVQIDPYRPFSRTLVKYEEIDDVLPSRVSTMPAGILNTFSKQQIRDLLGYLISPAGHTAEQ